MGARARLVAIVLGICLLGLLGLGRAMAAEDKPYTVFMVLWRGMTDAERGFQAYMRKNDIPVRYVIRNAGKDLEKLKRIRGEIRRTRPDLVYTFGTTVTRGVVGTTSHHDPDTFITDIPVVFDIVSDPVGARLTESLDSTGRNFTGTSHSVPLSTQLKTLLRIQHVKKLGALYNPLERNSALAIQKLARLAREKGIEFYPEYVRVKGGKPLLSSLPFKVKQLAARGLHFVYLPSDSFLISNAKEVIRALHARKLAAFSATEGPINDAGALAGIVSLYFNVGEFAGHKAAQILVGGRDPASIPIETLNRYTILVNMHTARELDFFPPVQVLEFAKVVGQ
ncbi:MAG TPA: ABC transporter substrate-binding protein [Gammaproteobacteria bacterium]|nr:ABC transporter substrate-binding protein [Gammaproteobacteria bacterium]